MFKKSMKYKVSEERTLPLKWVKMWQKLKVLLWKVYILRKRHFILTFLEILVPVVLFWLVVHFRNMLPEKKEIVTDVHPRLYTNITRVGNYKIAFSPSNNITESVMKVAAAKITASGCNVTLEPKSAEKDVVSWLKAEYVKDVKNKTHDYIFWVTSPKGLGVIFLDTGNINNLTYTLRTTRGGMGTEEDTLYGEQNGYGISKYEFSGFLTVQSAIDQAYLRVIQNISIPDDTQIITLPYVKYPVVDLIQLLMPTIVSLGFTFVMPSLLKEVVEERTSGIKEMMKIMGLNPFLNWLSWMVYSLLVYIPVTMAITLLLVTDSGTGPPVDSNFFFVWGMFVIFTFSFLTLILAISTFFTNGTIAMIAGELIWYGVTILFDTFVVNYPDKYNISIQLLTCVWPSIALVWAFRTIHNFHRSGHSWTLRDFFDDGAGGGRISVGLALLMLIVDIGIFSCLTWYMDNVKPGPYGRAKPLGFIFKCFKRKIQASNSVFLPKESLENFESVPKNISVGIRIENLFKSYGKGSLMAVKNVNLDIYRGNITALLGHNGAGKTTLMSMLAGFFSPTRGQVIVNDKNIFEHMDQFRSSLGLCPQHNLLFTYFTPLEHLIFFGMVKGMTMNQAKQKGETLLKTLQMYDRKDYTIAKLSGGMRRKVSLAIALLGDPEVVLLDEPTSGMDPESRRHVWDILLTQRGQKTIIITTHFMEEADVLGDRIAIMNHGQVSCYGTPMYLKRIYGKGYKLHVSKKDAASVKPIAQLVDQHTSTATMNMSSPSQLSFNIRAEDSSQFPSLFSELDKKKEDLGLTAINVNCTTMNDVFLRVIGGDSNERKGSVSSTEIQESNIVKMRGCKLMVQQIKALVYKRFLIRIRSWISTVVYVVVPVALMAATVLQLMYQDYSPVQNKLMITLVSFPKVTVAVKSDNTSVSDKIKRIVASGNAKYEEIPTTLDLEKYMIGKLSGNRDLIQYERSMIAGFESKDNSLIGGYSQYFDHSFSLVLNMMVNILLQLNNKSASITVYCYPIAVLDTEDECDRAMDAPDHVSSFPLKVIFLSLGLLMMTMSLIPFPLKERVTNLKQLTLMTGVSPLQYWLVTFLCDFILCLVTTALMICMILAFDQNSVFTTSGYIGTVFLIIVLFVCSGSLFAYLFTFFVKSSVKATVSFVVFNLAVGLFGATFLAILDKSYSYYGVWRFILSFNPLFSATSALIHLFTVMYLDGTCLQCGNNCKQTDPFQFIEGGQNSKNPHGINSFLIFLVVDTILYLGLVLILEYGLLKRLVFLISTIWIKFDEDNIYEEDGDVKQEIEEVHSYNKIAGLVQNKAILQVYDLGKKYDSKTTAVHNVTFQVEQGECFGLLGVNGAGKTTTFKMLTGEEIPNKGDANVRQFSLIRNKSMFLSQVGYCPQFDPISPLLTAAEMLTFFAMLRGIPPAECHSEVHKWIKILGLQEYSGRRCGTYSGGNNRKLSTAMAFIGAPSVVFLDEPTSGVDPVSRRRLWDIVAECKRTEQAIVLTSHSMEECETLCTRLTIMVGGRMKCIGSPQYLKHKFGQGYTIKVKMTSSVDRKNSLNLLKQEMTTRFKNCVLKDEHVGLLHYHLRDSSVPLAKLFQVMEKLKDSLAMIEDYVVSHTTLEEVFMSFAQTKNDQ